MCQFASKLHGEDKVIYDVISFHSEDILFWLFNCQAVEFHCNRKIYPLENEPVKVMSFAKKKQIGTKNEFRDGEKVKVPIYENLYPPSFYEKLRNRKVIEKYDITPKQRDFRFATDDSLKNQPVWDDEMIDTEAADRALEDIRRRNAERGYGQDQP